MHWEYVYNPDISRIPWSESLFPALVFGIYCKSTRKPLSPRFPVGAIIICLTFFILGSRLCGYGTIGLATAFVLMYVVS